MTTLVRLTVTFEIDGQPVAAEALGETLQNEMLETAMERMAQAIRQQPAVRLCPIHHQPPHAVVSLSSAEGLTTRIDGCCPGIIKATTRLLNDDLKQTAPFQMALDLLLHVRGATRPLVIRVDDIDEHVIGRGDPKSGYVPDIDLAGYGAADKGLSRQHAKLLWWHGALHIADVGSANGSYLNGQRLLPHEPYLLRTGDWLRLAEMAVQVRFEHPSDRD